MLSVCVSPCVLNIGIRSKLVVTFTTLPLNCWVKVSQYLPNSKLCGRQNSSGRLEEGNNALRPPEVERIFVTRSDRRLLNILNTLPWSQLRCLFDPSLLPSLLAVPLHVSTQIRFAGRDVKLMSLYASLFTRVVIGLCRSYNAGYKIQQRGSYITY